MTINNEDTVCTYMYIELSVGLVHKLHLIKRFDLHLRVAAAELLILGEIVRGHDGSCDHCRRRRPHASGGSNSFVDDTIDKRAM